MTITQQSVAYLLVAWATIAATGPFSWSQESRSATSSPRRIGDGMEFEQILYEVCDDGGYGSCDAMGGTHDGQFCESCGIFHGADGFRGVGNYSSSGEFVCFGGASGGVVQSPREWLRLDTPLTDALLDFQNRQTDKELFILEHQAAQRWAGPQVIVGGQSRMSLLAATTNRTNKFSYLGRFPTDFRGDSATDARMLQANAHATAHITPYASVYTELLFSDVFSFPAPKQGSLQVRQAYAVIGDLNVTPFYLYIGKKNIGFGDFSTLSPFTQAITWHYFASLAEGIGGGYHDSNWDFALTGINGGRGIRTLDSPEQGKLNNLAANASYHVGDAPDRHLRIGGGFLLGTSYDSSVAEHTNPNVFGDRYNSAWDVNARLDIDRMTFAGEYVTTTRDWPVTATPVSAYRTEAAYWLDRGPHGSKFSCSWGSGIQGPQGSEYEFNDQLVLGYGKRFGPHCRVSAEYVRSLGFAPLMDILKVSDRDVVQNSLVLGLDLVL